MSPSISESSPVTSPFEIMRTEPESNLALHHCRLCATETIDAIDIFSQAGKERGLPEKARSCLPVLITEEDDLPKTFCIQCCDKLEIVRSFFETCFNANQELIIQSRKIQGSPLDLNTHINQYVRSFNQPIVPSIKVEPTNYLDVGLNEECDAEGESDADYESGSEESPEIESSEEEEDKDNELFNENEDENQKVYDPSHKNGEEMFKVPHLPKTRKRGRPKKLNILNEQDLNDLDEFLGEKELKKNLTNRGRKKIVPMSLKTCSECNEVFDDHASNLTHWKSNHPELEVVYQCTEHDSGSEDTCNFQSKTVEEIFKHRKKHKSNDGSIKEKLVDCKICGKKYAPSYLITRHMLAHSDQKDYKCPLCGKDFKTSVDLKIHVKIHEEDEQKYTHCCELCGKRFTQRANLDAHLRVHSGFKPFACDFCGKSFSQKGNMEEHRRVHTGERPFVCELCGTSFVRRSEMALHTRIAHTGERPYQCNFCTKSFQRRDLMRKHERIHTDTRPYACQYCGKTFTQRDKMVVHTRLHTGERPYVCDICNKGFCESGNLKKHMRVHGKEPPPVMHQNNKGKPAPAQNPVYSGKYSQQHSRPNLGTQFQQALSNDDDSSNPSQTEAVGSPDPINNLAAHLQQNTVVNNQGLAANMAFNLKLEQQSAVPAVGQYPLSSVAVAAAAAAAANLAHSQIQNHQHPLLSHHHHHQSHHLSRSSNATPIQDIDNHSDACSERSVTSPVISAPAVTPNPIQNHHHQQPAFPYPMHHSLLQHLNDMRDWYGHLPQGGNTHNH